MIRCSPPGAGGGARDSSRCWCCVWCTAGDLHPYGDGGREASGRFGFGKETDQEFWCDVFCFDCAVLLGCAGSMAAMLAHVSSIHGEYSQWFLQAVRNPGALRSCWASLWKGVSLTPGFVWFECEQSSLVMVEGCGQTFDEMVLLGFDDQAFQDRVEHVKHGQEEHKKNVVEAAYSRTCRTTEKV